MPRGPRGSEPIKYTVTMGTAEFNVVVEKSDVKGPWIINTSPLGRAYIGSSFGWFTNMVKSRGGTITRS